MIRIAIPSRPSSRAPFAERIDHEAAIVALDVRCRRAAQGALGELLESPLVLAWLRGSMMLGRDESDITEGATRVHIDMDTAGRAPLVIDSMLAFGQEAAELDGAARWLEVVRRHVAECGVPTREAE